MNRQWTIGALEQLRRDAQRSADTHLLWVDLPGLKGVRLYLKDESTHPTGSLKHRLARSLFFYGICNGHIGEGTSIVEASSGSTAVSEAYFARMLGLPFVAVMPRGTSQAKIDQITFYGGRCHFVDDPSTVYHQAETLARELRGHYMDQFTFAERATDWRGNNNIAESIFLQMEGEPWPVPRWIVMSAGTGGTSATIGRYIRYRGLDTQLCVVDPEGSIFADYYRTRDKTLTSPSGSRIEGIGRPRVEPSFLPDVIDRLETVSTAASLAAMRQLERVLGRRYGGSTGTNFHGALKLGCEMVERGESGAIVTRACDAGDRYLDTYYNDDWLRQQGISIAAHQELLATACKEGRWSEPPPA